MVWLDIVLILSCQLMIANTALVAKQTSKNPYGETSEIIQFLKDGEKTIRFSPAKDIVLILGVTGSGKSTLTQFVSGNDEHLESVEVGADTGEYVIRDKNNKVCTRTTDSCTTVPDLIVDHETQVPFYDCPGFADTRHIKHDLSVTYFIKKIIDSAESIKLIFTVSYPSVRVGVDRQNFMLLVKNAVNMVKDVDKFKDSIALIVTKVDNISIYRKGKAVFVSDKNIIQNIASFLEEVKTNLLRKISENSLSESDLAFMEKSLTFIDVLLTKNGDDYPRIGIFRRPDDAGKLETPMMLKNKESLEKIIHENLEFTDCVSDDFGYTVSAETINRIYQIAEQVNKKIGSDFRAIAEEMSEGFHLQERDVSDVETLYRKFHFGFEAMRNVTNVEPSSDPRNFLSKIRSAAGVLDLDVPRQNVDSILHYDRFLKFVQVLSGMDTSNSLEWVEGLKDVVLSFDESQKWYHFLMNLHTTLLSHDVQKYLSKNSTNMDNLRENIRLYSGDDSAIKETLKQFLGQVYLVDSDKDYNSIKDAKLNSWKLKFLKDMLDFQVLTLCQDNKLVVVGNYVHLSDVARKQCRGVKFVEIFALSKLFIDADFDRTGSKIQLSMLSPTWEVIGGPKITLDGEPGWDHIMGTAKSGSGPGADGSNGLPGFPGGASGNFLGFGWNCINCQYLKVSADGGRGGRGQDGGDGQKGIDGVRPTRPNHHKNLVNLGLFRVSHDDKGNPGQPGGSGGMGGAGGNGGSAGQISIMMFDTPETSLPKTSAADGKSGAPGKSGIAGKGGNGEHVVESNTYILGMHAWSNGLVSHWFFPSTNGIVHDSSELNYDGLKRAEPPVALVNPSHAINNYKAYLRENLDSSLSRISLEEFLGQLETSKEIIDLYDTLGLVHDLQCLENQFPKLRRRVPLLPFYESLLDKIEAYSKDPLFSEISGQHKKVLALLYMSTLSKICTIGNNMNNDLVINVKEYLGTVVKDVDELLKGFMVAKQRNERRAMFQHVMTSRLKEANEFVEKDIVQETQSILTDLDNQIGKLILETNHLQNVSRLELKRLNEHMLSRAVSSVVKVACRALDLFGGLGTAAEELIEGTSLISESLAFDNVDSHWNKVLGAVPAALNDFFSSISDRIKDDINVFLQQLFHVDKILQGVGGGSVLNESRSAVSEAAEEFTQTFELSESPEEDLEMVDGKRSELVDFLQTQKNSLEKLVGGDPNLGKAVDALDRSASILTIPKGVYKMLNKNHVDASRSEFDENYKLKQLEEYEKRIYTDLIPLCKRLKEQFDQMDRFGGQSHVALDVGKWKAQNALTDIQTQILSMTEGFQIEGPVAVTIEKLKFGMSTMIQVYDRIQDYRDQAALADYMADISSNEAKTIQVTDRKLNDAVDNLQVIMKTNLILSEYEKAMSAFGQHVFPFAKVYMAEYDLPTSLRAENSTEDLVSEAIYKINSIERKLIKNDLTINKGLDDHLFLDVPFTAASPYGPFYVWKYETSSSEISRLFQGKEVALHADIVKGLNYNAVKFNEIGIRFKFANVADQLDFDEVMEKFIVEMNHFGLSYFRCGSQFYVMNHDTQKIAHSVNEDDRGRFYLRNGVYDKISRNEPLLSPYTMWKVKLHNVSGSFKELAKFEGLIVDMALEGTGMFVDRLVDRDVCNDHLDLYYKVDDTINEVPAIEYKIDRNLTDAPEVVAARRRRRGVDYDEFPNYEQSKDSPRVNPLDRFVQWFTGEAAGTPADDLHLQPNRYDDSQSDFYHQTFETFADYVDIEEPSSTNLPSDDDLSSNLANLSLLDLLMGSQTASKLSENTHVNDLDDDYQNIAIRSYDPANDKEIIIVQ